MNKKATQPVRVKVTAAGLHAANKKAAARAKTILRKSRVKPEDMARRVGI